LFLANQFGKGRHDGEGVLEPLQGRGKIPREEGRGRFRASGEKEMKWKRKALISLIVFLEKSFIGRVPSGAILSLEKSISRRYIDVYHLVFDQ
jgi:hypothetical protein